MLSAALLATAAAAPVVARDISTTRYARNGWITTVRYDAFTGARHCLLRTRDRSIVYQPAALGFRVHSRDTLGAVYRVDDGAPVRWADRYPELTAAGVEVEGPALDDPTAGIVWIPQSDVVGAKTVRIRAAVGQRIRRYDIAGAAGAIADTRQMGCALHASFGN